MTLWTIGPISCTCVTLADGHIEICLVSGTATIERRLFDDPDEATNFAIEKMRAYTIH